MLTYIEKTKTEVIQIILLKLKFVNKKRKKKKKLLNNNYTLNLFLHRL